MMGEIETKSFVFSVFSGLIFGLSWWVIIDIFAIQPSALSYRTGILLCPPIMGTISLIGNNLVPNASLVDTVVTRRVFCSRFIFFFTMVLGFAAVCTSIIISATVKHEELSLYGIIAMPICNVFILVSNFMFKFGTLDGTEDAY